MKTIDNILNAKNNKRFGNHYVKIDGCIRSCIYHGTLICMINTETKEFFINRNEIFSIGSSRAAYKYTKGLTKRGFVEFTGNNLQTVL